MTRKDYETLAQTFAKEVAVWTGVPYANMRLRAIESMAARLANALQEDNPRFDVGLFMTNCGFSQGRAA